MSFANTNGFVILAIVAPLVIFGMLRSRGRRSLPSFAFALGLRLASIICLCLTISEPYYSKEREVSNAVFLLDISDSLEETVADELVQKINALSSQGIKFDAMPFAGNVGTTLFGGEDLSYRRIKEAWAKLDIGATDIEKAIVEVNSKGSGSIVILSDGNETRGSVEKALPSLQLSNARIFPLVPTQSTGKAPSLQISNLYAPLMAPVQKSVDIRVSMQNSTTLPQSGLLEVSHDKKVVLKESVTVEPGRELLVIAHSDPSLEGIREITATLTPDTKTFPSTSRTIYLSGQVREKILLVSGSEVDARFLKETLEGQAYQTKSIIADEKIAELPTLSDYSAVLFNNISVEQIPRSAPQLINEYVEGGGGFIMLGGNRSFGLGGYIGTAIEEALPVEMVPPQTLKKRLNVAVELILDKSRSMDTNSKLDFAKEAAREVIKNLKDEDFVGVIGFDSSPFVVVKLGQLQMIRAQALDRVGRLFPAGRTNLLPAIDEARRSLVRASAGRKHMIILTDGKIPDEGPYYLELVKQMRVMGITVSTVLLGGDVDVGILQSMAEFGGGAFYQTENARALPRIFISDIKTTTGERTLKEQQEYLVTRGRDGIKSTQLSSFPPVRGYVETRARDRAALELVAYADEKAEPLLASWMFGKGKSVAFTSDANGRWSNYWISWSKFHNFWSDLVESVRPQAGGERDDIRFDLKYSVEQGALNLDLTLFSEAPTLLATLTFPDGGVRNVEFSNVARGHYRAKMLNVVAGKYEMHANVGSRKLTPVAFYLRGDLFGERRGEGFNLPLLEKLAGATGGKINPSVKDLKEQVYKETKKQGLGWLFMLVALMLMCIEILRREVWGIRVGARRSSTSFSSTL